LSCRGRSYATGATESAAQWVSIRAGLGEYSETVDRDGDRTRLMLTSGDLWGAWVDSNGDIFLTARGTFAVAGVSGTGSDVYACNNPTAGDTTICGSFSLFFDGSANGYGSEITDGIHVTHN